MKLKNLIPLLLCVCLLAGCGGQAGTEVQMTTENTMEPTTEAVTEETEPDDGRIKMYYDDRMPLTELTGVQASSAEAFEVEVITEEITSKALGTQEADEAVLYHDVEGGRLIAVGTGTATVIIDGVSYEIRVRPAPISLVMITGHSLGAGQQGNAAQSVLCEDGQAYSSTLADNITFPAAQTGIGYASAEKPSGIDALTSQGSGVQGEAGGLAYRWNQLTDEKIWVINAAVGGSCLNEWYQGCEYYNNAAALFMKAQFTLSGEIASGHYKLKNMAILYHSAANFSYKDVTFNNSTLEKWYTSMWNGFKSGLAYDMDNDGKTEELDGIGFIPLWTTGTVGSYTLDRPANYYMAVSETYPDMFMASLASADWMSVQGIMQDFPQIDYETHGESVTKPVLPTDILADGVHLTQVAYNASGMDIADNLYAFLRQNVKAQSVTLLTEYGIEVDGTLKIGKIGLETPLILIAEPYSASDLTITVSDNLTLSYPFIITATQSGTGTITISQGDTVLKTVTVTVP